MIYLAVALYDYAPTAGSANCFAFQAGDSFTVHRQDTSGWFDVSREDGKRAWVPGALSCSSTIQLALKPRRQLSREVGR